MKVYCKNCCFLKNALASYKCVAPQNSGSVNWYGPNTGKDKPFEKNFNNACNWYKAKK